MNNKYLTLVFATAAGFLIAALPHKAMAQTTYNANIPLPYQEPGGNARAADASFGVESIDPFTGALKIVTTDLVVPSNGGMDLKVVRNYQSLQGTAYSNVPYKLSMLGRTTTGVGWDLHFGRLWVGAVGRGGPQLAAVTTTTSNACRQYGGLFNNATTSKENPVLELPDGSRQLFAASDSAETGFAYISPDRWILKCLPSSQDPYSNGGAIAISPDGVKYTLNFFYRVSSGSSSNIPGITYDLNYNYAYHVTKIEHPNGTSITITYLSKASSTYASLTKVQHSEGQSILFAYSTRDSCPSSPSSTANAHLDSFTQGGRTWHLNYICAVKFSDFTFSLPDRFEYLESVDRPDGRSTHYEYNGLVSAATSVPGQFSLSKVTVPLGGRVNYYYSRATFPTRDVITNAATQNPIRDVVVKKEVRGRVKTLPGVLSQDNPDTWDYYYNPSTNSSVTSDFTHISGPTSCVTYEHYVGWDPTLTWKIGALLTRATRSPNSASGSSACTSSTVLRTETNTWVASQVAAQFMFRDPNIPLNSPTCAPRLSKTVATQDGSNYTTEYKTPDSFDNPQQIVETGVTTSTTTGIAGTIARTTNYTYFTDRPNWIIHRVKNESVPNAGTTYATPGSAGVSSVYDVVRTYFTSGTKIGLLQQESRAGVPTSYDYFTDGTLSSITDANKFATTYANYVRGTPQIVSREIDGSGNNYQIINRSVNSVINPSTSLYDSGTLAWQQDGEGKQTSYAYNAINQLISVTTASTKDSDVTITHSGAIDTVMRGNYKEIRKYDGFGLQYETDWSDNDSTTAPIFQFNMFDAESRPIRQYPASNTLPNSNSTYSGLTYDALGRPTLVKNPGDSSTIRYEYLNNNITRVTDERGFQILYYYRSFGDPSKQELVRIRADGGDSPGANSGNYQTTIIDRNLLGQVNSISQEGIVRTYKYNSNFFLFEEDHPEVGSIIYTHDNIGNVLTRKVGTSGTTIYTLDRLYRADYVTYPDGLNVDFDYYKNDRLKFVAKGNTRWDYSYDANNNLQLEKLTLTASTPSFPVARIYQFDYSYDVLDAQQTVTYPSGLQLNYAPDVFGRPTGVSATQSGSAITGFASGVSYYPNGQLSSITLPNGVTTNYGQDGRLRLSNFTAAGPFNGSTQQLVSRLYQYDVANNVSSITDYLAGSNTKSMTYDGLGRLRTANGAWGGGAVSYYPNNNIATKTFGADSLTFNYDGSNKLASVTGTTPLSFGYDVYGNATSSGRSTFGNYQYDDESLLRYVRNADGTTKIEYAHDGERHTAVERYVDGWSTKYKAYANGALMCEEDVVNNISKDYVYLGSRLIGTRTRCTSTLDSDGDGISDCLEFQNGLNRSNAADAGQDADNDGVSNATEIQLGLNVYVADTDGDGLSDGYEVSHGLNALVSDSTADPDGDGLNNLKEASMGTNPLKADTDGDGIPDNLDPKPLFNPAWLIPIFNLLLD